MTSSPPRRGPRPLGLDSHALTWAALALGLLSGCASTASKDASPAGGAGRMLAADIQGEQVVETFDLNGDGEPDVWKVWVIPRAPRDAARVLARKDVDMNFDGKVDLRTHFDPEGNIVKEESNLDFDGEFDAVDYYEGGRLVRRDMTLSPDGRLRVRKHFQDGVLVRKERDDDGDGRIESWEYFRDGALVRIGRDTTGDGRPDVFEDTASEGEPASSDTSGARRPAGDASPAPPGARRTP